VTTLVVDTSIVAKWFLDEEHSEIALSLLENDLHAPELLEVELAHTLCKKVRRGELEADEARSILRCFEDFPVQRHETVFLQDLAFDFALAHGRGIYDCLFVALAEILDTRVVTADRRLVRGLRGTSLEQRVLWVAEGLG
jgi:predicted nucleic acid-binding protein